MPTARSSGRCWCSTPRTSLTDWVDTVVLWRIDADRHGVEGPAARRYRRECALLALRLAAWLPIYLLIYWVPRLFR